MGTVSQAELTVAELLSLCTYPSAHTHTHTHRPTHTPSENTSGGFDKKPPPTFLLVSCSLSQHLGRQLASPPLLAAITLIITPVDHMLRPPSRKENIKSRGAKWTFTQFAHSDNKRSKHDCRKHS